MAELRFFAAIARPAPDALFFVGDQGQRILRPPFSWKELGIDIGGRSHMLKVNYRTSEQIRQMSDRLLPAMVDDTDGMEEKRAESVSVFSGPEPIVCEFAAVEDERDAVAAWIGERLADGNTASDIGVLVRSENYLRRAEATVQVAGRNTVRLTHAIVEIVRGIGDGRVPVGLIEEAKGFEFKAVAVMACDKNAFPLESRMATAENDAEREELLLAERRLLYAGCTRAREHLFVSGVVPTSPFLALSAQPRSANVCDEQ